MKGGGKERKRDLFFGVQRALYYYVFESLN